MNQKKLAILLVPIFILTILWVIFNVYHSHVDSTIKDPLNYQIIPIEGTFNTDAIDRIKERSRIDAANELTAPEAEELSPSPSPSPTPELEDETASESAETENEE